jgi:hypothetical protein
VDPSELPAMFAAIEAKVADRGATVAVTAMGRTFQRAVKRTLSVTSHPPGAFSIVPRGAPPSLASGELRRSVQFAPGASGGVVASSSVAPHTVYAGVQEFGLPDPIRAVHRKYMRFTTDGKVYYMKEVHVGPHPYMRPTIARCIGNGSLGRAAGKAFEIAVWGA